MTYYRRPFVGLQGYVGHMMTVSGWVAAMLTVLHSPVHAPIHLTARQALLLLELFMFK